MHMVTVLLPSEASPLAELILAIVMPFPPSLSIQFWRTKVVNLFWHLRIQNSHYGKLKISGLFNWKVVTHESGVAGGWVWARQHMERGAFQSSGLGSQRKWV